MSLNLLKAWQEARNQLDAAGLPSPVIDVARIDTESV